MITPRSRDLAWFLAALVAASLSIPALAGPNTEVEPNNALPGIAPSAGPLLQPGATIHGVITPGDVDLIQVTVPGIDPPTEGLPTLSRRVFEVATSGDVTLDLIEPSTGRVLASSDDAPGGVAGAGPGSARCAFDLLDAPQTPTQWTLAIRGFWPSEAFDYEVRYAVETVAPPQAVTLEPFQPEFAIDSLAPGEARWYALTLVDDGWLRVQATPVGGFPPDLGVALLDSTGQCVAFADDIFDAPIDYWQSSDTPLSGTFYLVIAPASMRTALGVPVPEPGPTPPPLLWNRAGVGLGEQVGWYLLLGESGYQRVAGGSFRVDFEHGTPPVPCEADFDHNGGLDGADLAAFMTVYEAGEESADIDENGGIDGADLAYFFVHYELGC